MEILTARVGGTPRGNTDQGGFVVRAGRPHILDRKPI